MRRALLGAALCLCAVTACAPDLSPQDVADRFWRAVITADATKIQRYVRVADKSSLEAGTALLPVTEVSFGRMMIEADSATVTTQVSLLGEPPMTIPLVTQLVREDEVWRVDYPATVGPIARSGELAGVIEQLEQLGDTLKRGIDKSVDELSAAVPLVERELSRIEAEIQQRMPQLRQQLETFSRRLEEALKRAPAPGNPVPQPSPAPGGTTAI